MPYIMIFGKQILELFLKLHLVYIYKLLFNVIVYIIQLY